MSGSPPAPKSPNIGSRNTRRPMLDKLRKSIDGADQGLMQRIERVN
jgi:hypothetical protein